MKNTEIQSKIMGLLGTLGFTEGEVSVTHDEGGSLWFSISSPGTRLLLTRDAEALTALNHLAMRMVEHMIPEEKERTRVVIDANGFEKKKIEALKTIAHMMAERARYFKASVDVEPMNPHDRRVVHEFISSMPDLSTESVGMGKDRHIVIKYIGAI